MKFVLILCIAVLLLLTLSFRVGTRNSDVHAQRDRTLQATRPSDNEIVLTRTFAAPPKTVFAALTEPEHLVRWMQTTDMTLVACEVDLRVGGTFRYVFQRRSGARIEVRGAYEAVDPPRGFRYRESYDFSPLKVLVSTNLDATDQETIFKQTLTYSSKRERDDDFDGVFTSSKEAFARLERYLPQFRN